MTGPLNSDARPGPGPPGPAASPRPRPAGQTRLDSYVRPPATMPSSSEEDEPVAQVSRSGHRAKRSQRQASARRSSPRTCRSPTRASPSWPLCLVIGIQRAGRRRAPDGYGLGTRTDVNLGIPQPILINQGVMATLQERRLGYHSRAGLEPGTSSLRFFTLLINHYAAWGMYRSGSADRHISRSSGADRMHMSAGRVMSAVIP